MGGAPYASFLRPWSLLQLLTLQIVVVSCHLYLWWSPLSVIVRTYEVAAHAVKADMLHHGCVVAVGV